MSNAYLVMGIVVFFDHGASYTILCKSCYDDVIDDLRKEKNITNEEPIFLSSETDTPYICEECNEEIECEVMQY